MITRQRLGQLIKEEKFIYTTRLGGKKPEKFKLYKDFYMSQKDTLCCLNKSHEFLVCEVKFKYLFETKEEAEWQLEFGNIQRMETLNLPDFVKVENDDWLEIDFTNKYKEMCEIIIENGIILIYNKIKVKTYFRRELTKENYIKACRLAKKLFLGE